MASITIRNLDDGVKTRLRMRAVEHGRSMEEEVRIILREAVSDGVAGPRDLAKFTRECFAPLGGVELELPPRGPMREPLGFTASDVCVEHECGFRNRAAGGQRTPLSRWRKGLL